MAAVGSPMKKVRVEMRRMDVGLGERLRSSRDRAALQVVQLGSSLDAVKAPRKPYVPTGNPRGRPKGSGTGRKVCEPTGEDLKKVEECHKEPEMCPKCGKEFGEPGLLAGHLADASAHVRPYRCSLQTCRRTFTQLLHLANHRLLHPDPRPHTCSSCLIAFSTENRLVSHRVSCLPYPPSRTLSGPSCTFPFSRPDLHHLHQVLRHQGALALALPCPSCDEVLPSEAALAEHEQTHVASLKAGRLVCTADGCGAEFPGGQLLADHLAAHHGERRSCRSCGEVFDAPLEMLGHRLSCERRAPRELLACPTCPRTFKAQAHLHHHLATACAGLQELSCDSPDCGKTFSKARLLRNHLYSHTDSPLHCRHQSCGRSFALLHNYTKHCNDQHGGQLDLIHCDSCSEVFTVQSHLDSHKDNIHKEISYDINIFEDEEQETGVDCPFCKKWFASLSLLRVHLVSLHPPPWTCGCGEALPSLLLTRRHLASCNSTEMVKKAEQEEIGTDVEDTVVGDIETTTETSMEEGQSLDEKVEGSTEQEEEVFDLSNESDQDINGNEVDPDIGSVQTKDKFEEDDQWQGHEDDLDDAVEITDAGMEVSMEEASGVFDDEDEVVNDAVEVTDETESMDKVEKSSNPGKVGVAIHDVNSLQDDIAAGKGVVVKREVGGGGHDLGGAPPDPPEGAGHQAEARRLHLAVVEAAGCPRVGDFASKFGISANSLQLAVVPEVLEVQGEQGSLTRGLAVDLLDLAVAKGVELERLVEYLRLLLPPAAREPVSTVGRNH